MWAMNKEIGLQIMLATLGRNRAAGLIAAIGPGDDIMVASLMYSAVRSDLANVAKKGYSLPAHAGAARDTITGNIAAKNNQSRFPNWFPPAMPVASSTMTRACSITAPATTIQQAVAG